MVCVLARIYRPRNSRRRKRRIDCSADGGKKNFLFHHHRHRRPSSPTAHTDWEEKGTGYIRARWMVNRLKLLVSRHFQFERLTSNERRVQNTLTLYLYCETIASQLNLCFFVVVVVGSCRCCCCLYRSDIQDDCYHNFFLFIKPYTPIRIRTKTLGERRVYKCIHMHSGVRPWCGPVIIRRKINWNLLSSARDSIHVDNGINQSKMRIAHIAYDFAFRLHFRFSWNDKW